MELGKTIKILRIAAGLKQEDLAQKLGVSSNYISLVENNKREPSLSFLKAVAEELDVPIGLLFLDVDKSKFRDTPEKQELMKRIRDLILDIERLRLQQKS